MNSYLDPDTVIKNWFLIDFVNDGKSMNKRVLLGIVVQDFKGRWIPGDWCCTSLVLREFEGQVYQTKNSIYQAEGEGQRLSAPVETINLLRSGYSPDDWATLADLKDLFPQKT